MKIEPLSDVAGARITGVDLAQQLPIDVVRQAEQALHSHGFVVFPGQTVSPQQFMQFSRAWGKAEPHVIDTFHHPAEANILMLSNVTRGGLPIGLLDAGTYFHTDYSYLTVPARCTMLYAIQMPRERSGTTFANQTLAYADLPQTTKQQIDPLVVRHHYGNRDDLNLQSRTVASVLSDSQKKKVDWVRHRLVRPHPHTGVPALYGVSGSAFGIDGMNDAQALVLLRSLTEHATAARYCQTYNYSIGDVVVWDNAQLLHAAPLTQLTDARTLWRITVKEAA